MIINSHVHLNTDTNFFFYNDYGIKRFLQEMQENGISLAMPALNPKVSIFRCQNDCSMHCPLLSCKESIFTGHPNNTGKSIINSFSSQSISQQRVSDLPCALYPIVSKPSMQNFVNNNLNDCNCTNPNRHRVGIFEEEGKLVLKCKTCGNIIFYSTFDPLHKYNVALINLTKPYRKRVRPLIYLSLCHSTIQTEIDFFEKCYGNEFVGFKLHPWNDQVSVADFMLHSSKPILIHTGIRDLESGANAIAFAKNNPNVKIVIAHASALDENCLRQIAIMENVFVDCCPSVFMFKNRFSSFLSPEDIHSPEDIYYKVLDYVPSDKILFGSDSPWGNSRDELDVVNRLHIPESVREQILYKNATEFYGLEFC